MWRAIKGSGLGFWECWVVVQVLALPIQAASYQKGRWGNIMVQGCVGERQQQRNVAGRGCVRHGSWMWHPSVCQHPTALGRVVVMRGRGLGCPHRRGALLGGGKSRGRGERRG